MSEPAGRSRAEELLEELGAKARLTIYLAIAPGAGKTRRLIDDALALRNAGVDVAIGLLETKQRSDLDVLSAGIPRIPTRKVTIGSATLEEFDLDAALALRPQAIVLDELAHTNLPGSRNAKRWQDAIALREAGISVLTAFNIQHLETAAPTAERLIGFPVREIIPQSVLKTADAVVAIDVSPDELRSRLIAGKIVRGDDVERAANGIFRPQTLAMLRQLMLRAIDDVTQPSLSPSKTSTELAIVVPDMDPAPFLRKAAAVAHALDLAIEIAPLPRVDIENIERLARTHDATVTSLNGFDPNKPDLGNLKAALIALPRGELAKRIANTPLDRDVFVVDPALPAFWADTSVCRVVDGHTLGDRLRIGYGKLTIFLGAAAGSGKTYAMLDRAHQLVKEGVDVVAALVETHGRAETTAKLEGLELLPRRTIVAEGVQYGELDRDALIKRNPQIALIDELAHTNESGDAFPKRFEDVLSVARAGISVMTTLNIQHLEGLGDAIARLTGVRVRETVPDSILERADEVIFVDATPQTLRERLRAGKIYPPECIEAALANFFKIENLTALRELALRESVHARTAVRDPAPFSRFLAGVAGRERDVDVIARCARIARRLEIDFAVAHVAANEAAAESRAVAALRQAAERARARWFVSTGEAAPGMIEIAKQTGYETIAVEGVRYSRGWLRKPSFARMLLDAGAVQLLILSPAP